MKYEKIDNSLKTYMVPEAVAVELMTEQATLIGSQLEDYDENIIM